MDGKNSAATAILPVVKVALLCAFFSLVLAFVDERLAVLPLAVFVLCCLAAPFFPRLGFFLPVISRGPAAGSRVALTFDDGPDPATTPLLLELLAQHDVPATFFVIGEKAAAHPGLMRAIVAAGHTVGNHSRTHDVLLMLRSSRRLYRDVAAAQKILARFGRVPWAFRPPAGITNPRLGRILRSLDLRCITFSCRGFDRGNRRIAGLAGKILGNVKAGDIILLHDCKPRGAATVAHWLGEIEALLSGLAGKKFTSVPLEHLIRQPRRQPQFN